MPEADEVDYELFDKFLTQQVMLPSKDKLRRGTVKRRRVDESGNPLGKSHSDPARNTA